MNHILHRGSRTTAVLAILSAAMGTAAAGQGCHAELDAASHTRPGQRMPAIALTETDGQLFRLSEQRGKVVFVNFWATWCPPCRQEMPRLEAEVWQRHRDDPGFRMVAVAREQTDADIKAFQVKSHYSFPLASDPKRSTYALFADSGIPRSYVVGRDGTILAESVGYCKEDLDHLEAVLDEALRQKS